jgi:hypothetical protein
VLKLNSISEQAIIKGKRKRKTLFSGVIKSVKLTSSKEAFIGILHNSIIDEINRIYFHKISHSLSGENTFID